MKKCSNCSRACEENHSKCPVCLVHRNNEYKRRKALGGCVSCPISKQNPRAFGLLCQACYDKKVDYYCREKENIAARQRLNNSLNKDRRRASTAKAKAKFKSTKPIESRLYAIRQNAKLRNLEFSLTPADIKIPEYCPILGCKLSNEKGPTQWSVDRVDSTIGYVPSNIQIISLQANRLKGSLSIHQVKAILNYLLEHLPKPNACA